jgi:four helix bundle protein
MTGRFAHHRLDAYVVAQELAEGAVRLTRKLPRGFSDLRDQLNRSALATVRHIAEGASRRSPADKR